jgi:guanylate kinase
MNQGKLFILSAPSGTGKTTVLTKVMANIDGIAFYVSHTTRKPRHGEQDGKDYHFVNREDFLAIKEKGDFLECAEVHGNLYGTSSLAVQEQIENGIDVILDIDVQGARIVRASEETKGIYIFITPPSLDELERRLRGRGQDSEETIATRLANARFEMEAVDEYDYYIVNDDVDETARMFEAIILAERSRGRRLINGKAIQPFEKNR